MRNSEPASDGIHTSVPKSSARPSEAEAPAAVDRKSPPTERVVNILNLLADTPRKRLTLTQIAAELHLNKPTCLGILAALTDADFVTRDESKSYGLGPALLRLGSAAESGHASLDLVRPFVAELHELLGVGCILSAAHEGHTVIVDRMGTAIPGDRRDLIGERLPLAPPLGLVNIAWQRERVVNAWLERTPLIPLAAGEEIVRAIIEEGHERGYIIECLRTSTSSSVVLASLLASGMAPRIIDELCQHLPAEDWSEFITTMPADQTAIIPIANISAPIFDRHGAQQYTLTIVPERADATAALANEWGTATARAARAATTALGG
ncbi:helix-turn-helix domain-containing protein [Nocardia cyriacigeorgica]|uniref:IclR family transcriptional regulator n=1 Tax=Nocardia cyriacigeorgica TaxID=135487 RepID=UPI0013B7C560|nr:helix-turn-helix domain-containing protein [Nocardia cyriacigeorgica]NEW48976.1 helix-turn-helix domain-containing protein [Nocardia cyriacigeorgica]